MALDRVAASVGVREESVYPVLLKLRFQCILEVHHL